MDFADLFKYLNADYLSQKGKLKNYEKELHVFGIEGVRKIKS